MAGICITQVPKGAGRGTGLQVSPVKIRRHTGQGVWGLKPEARGRKLLCKCRQTGPPQVHTSTEYQSPAPYSISDTTSRLPAVGLRKTNKQHKAWGSYLGCTE